MKEELEGFFYRAQEGGLCIKGKDGRIYILEQYLDDFLRGTKVKITIEKVIEL